MGGTEREESRTKAETETDDAKICDSKTRGSST